MSPRTRRMTVAAAYSTVLTATAACAMTAPGSGGVAPLGVGVALGAAGAPWLLLAVLRRAARRSETRVVWAPQPEPQLREELMQ